MAKSDLPIIEQRRIEAAIIKPIYEELKRELGEREAKRIIGAAVRKDAVAQGRAYARSGRDFAGRISRPVSPVDRERRTRGRGPRGIRNRPSLRRHALPLCRDVPADGALRDRTPPFLRQGRHLLHRLRPPESSSLEPGPSCRARATATSTTGGSRMEGKARALPFRIPAAPLRRIRPIRRAGAPSRPDGLEAPRRTPLRTSCRAAARRAARTSARGGERARVRRGD